MTAFLLDTHAFVWAVSDPGRLGRDAHRVITDPRSELWVSAASAFELATKHRRGRFPEAAPLVERFTHLVAQLRGRPLDITAPEALRAGSLAWEHADPFDRLLAAQALVRDVALVTVDAAFGALGGLRTVW